MSNKEKPKEHGPHHTWVWRHQSEENDSYTRIIYDDNIAEADVVCTFPECGVRIPGDQYIGAVEKMRQFLHLGEEEHIERLQNMLEILALAHEHDGAAESGDKV
jgi:hypothetical protein